MSIFSILNSRNILLLMGGMYLYSFVLSPLIMQWSRDKSYDFTNSIHKNESLCFRLYFGTQNKFAPNTDKLIFEKNIPYLPKKKAVLQNVTFSIPLSITENKTSGYYKLHVFSNEIGERSDSINTYSTKKVVNWWIPKQKNYRNLVKSNSTEKTEEKKKPVPFVYATIRYDLVYIDGIANPTAMYPFDKRYFEFRSDGTFRPAAVFDTFYDMPTEKRRVNITEGHNVTLPLEINIRRYWSFSFKNLMNYNIGMMEQFGELGTFMEGRFNEIKRIFVETDPTLLWTTGVATILHFIFSVLAFENDMKFWLKKSSFRGVSMRSIVNTLLSDTIIFLYVVDNDTPTVMRVLDFLNICKSLWKISKLVDFHFRWPFMTVKEELKGDSDDADSEGMKYLYFIISPLLIIYFVYELFTSEFASVRSYIIHCLAGAMYSFGFLGMIPQLVVNYRLKTVAGMSKAALVYKFINTFIDDLYTFVSKMPLMTKIACFRDDVIFVIWVIQCCIYDTDPTRPNEFNLVKKESTEEEDKKEKDEKKQEEKKELPNENGKLKTE